MCSTIITYHHTGWACLLDQFCDLTEKIWGWCLETLGRFEKGLVLAGFQKATDGILFQGENWESHPQHCCRIFAACKRLFAVVIFCLPRHESTGSASGAAKPRFCLR